MGDGSRQLSLKHPGTLELYAIESRFPGVHETFYLQEPLASSADALWERLSTGSYDKPFLVEADGERYLQFDLYHTQSAMSLAHPDWLLLEYTRSMMAFLLFNEAPERILLLGLGGGSLLKFCYRYLPRAEFTAIEVNPWVLSLRPHFHIPHDNDRLRVKLAEGGEYVATEARTKDIILVDAGDRYGLVPACTRREFYEETHRRLASGGILVVNIFDYTARGATQLALIQEVFGESFLHLNVPQEGNVVAFAFKERDRSFDWKVLQRRAQDLELRYGLGFSKYVRRFARSWVLRHG